MTVISVGKQPSFLGDSVEFDDTISIGNFSLEEIKEASLKYSQLEMGFRRLGIPTIEGSILFSLENGFYKNPQQVIDLIKTNNPKEYKTLKKNFPDIFEDLEKQGIEI